MGPQVRNPGRPDRAGVHVQGRLHTSRLKVDLTGKGSPIIRHGQSRSEACQGFLEGARDLLDLLGTEVRADVEVDRSR